MFTVHSNYGEPIHFPDGATYEIEETGRLRIYVNDIDVALFADGGWYAVTRPLPEPEAPEATYSDEDAEDDEA